MPSITDRAPRTNGSQVTWAPEQPDLSSKESAVLGALLESYAEAIAHQPIAALIQAAPDSFTDGRHAALAVAIRSTRGADLTALSQSLNGQLADIGGPAFLSEVMQAALPN
jgi:hypothetical protein